MEEESGEQVRNLEKELYDKMLDSFTENEKNQFRMLEMNFNGENYPLSEDGMNNMIDKLKSITTSKEKFIAISALFFSLYKIHGE